MRLPLVLLAFVTPVACGDGAERFDRQRTGAMEIVLAFREGPDRFATPDPARVRRAVVAAGARDIEIEPLQRRVEDAMRPAVLVRIAYLEWPPAAPREMAVTELKRRHQDVLDRVEWSGNRLHLRSHAALDEREVRGELEKVGLVVTEWNAGPPEEGTGEYRTSVRVAGIEGAIERALEAAFAGTDVVVADVQAVGPLPGGRRP
ncbi:MAG TPA: hypothetical protein VM261_04870 [Kofleriaceae bacterium]|nr:hypothetical protein [Kofleriaceae bacterium]